MISIREVDSNEKRYFRRMQEQVLRYCDPDRANRYIPNRVCRERIRKHRADTGDLYSQLKTSKLPTEMILYLPSDNSRFSTNYIRAWFTYFYKCVLPRIFNNPLLERYDWMYSRLIESIKCVSGARVAGFHYESELNFESTTEFARRANVVMDVIKEWAPMELKRFILAKIPKFDKRGGNKKDKSKDFAFTLAMFEFTIASYCKAIWQPAEREITHRILDYMFQGKPGIDVADDHILQTFYAVVEVSKIAAEQALRRLLTSVDGDMDRNQKMILFCFNESRFSFELFSNILVRLLKPSVAFADAKSRKDAKRAMLLAYWLLKFNAEVEVCELRRDTFILPGKYLLILSQDKVLQADAEKLFNRIAKTYPSIMDTIKDSEHVNIPLTYNYDEW